MGWIDATPALPHPTDPALEPSYATAWTQWAGAIVGACLVGLTGEQEHISFVSIFHSTKSLSLVFLIQPDIQAFFPCG